MPIEAPPQLHKGPKVYDLDLPLEDCTDCPRTTYIRKMNVTIIDCGAMLHRDICDLWNNTRCSNDSCYCNPFIKGDKIYLQFNLPIHVFVAPGFSPGPIPIIIPGYTTLQTDSEWNKDYFAGLIDENGNLIPEFSEISTFTSEKGIGIDKKGKPYVWMVIDTEKLPDNLCNFNVTITDGNLETGYPAIVNQFYTEPYCCVKCEESTILVSSFYKNYDPFGGFYGEFLPGSFTGDPNGFKASIRVYGNVEKTSNKIENTLIGLHHIKTKMQINPAYLLRTLPLPLYVADLLTVALAGQTLVIDGKLYDSPESVDKNNEEGSMWVVSTPLNLLTDQINFECDIN